jgi:hypothetical protein
LRLRRFGGSGRFGESEVLPFDRHDAVRVLDSIIGKARGVFDEITEPLLRRQGEQSEDLRHGRIAIEQTPPNVHGGQRGAVRRRHG